MQLKLEAHSPKVSYGDVCRASSFINASCVLGVKHEPVPSSQGHDSLLLTLWEFSSFSWLYSRENTAGWEEEGGSSVRSRDSRCSVHTMTSTADRTVRYRKPVFTRSSKLKIHHKPLFLWGRNEGIIFLSSHTWLQHSGCGTGGWGSWRPVWNLSKG